MKRVFKLIGNRPNFAFLDEINRPCNDEIRIVTIEPETRTLQQNAAQWPILNAIADQILWPVNGKMERLIGKEFKDILTAGHKNEVIRLAQGVNGGVVMLGLRTSEFKKNEWGEWMEYLHWFAAEKGVKIPVSKKEAEAWGMQ